MTPRRERPEDNEPEDLAEVAGLDEDPDQPQEPEPEDSQGPPTPPTRGERDERPEPDDLLAYIDDEGEPRSEVDHLQEATLAALETIPIEDERLEQEILEALTARVHLPGLPAPELRETVLDGLREPFEDPQLEAAFIDAVQTHLQEAPPTANDPDATSRQDSAETPDASSSAAMLHAPPTPPVSEPPPQPGPEPGQEHEPESGDATGRQTPLPPSEVEDAVLMALQEQGLEDPELEARLLEAMTSALDDAGEDDDLGELVLERVTDEIEDLELADALTAKIKTRLAEAQAQHDAQQAQAEQAAQEADVQDGEGAPEDLMEGEIEELEDPALASAEADRLPPSEVEDAVLMALQEQGLEDPELEARLLEAMTSALDDAGEDDDLGELVLERVTDEIEDPELADALTAKIKTRLAEAQAQHDAQQPGVGEEDDADLEEVEVEEAEVEELDEHELEEVGEDQGAKILQDLSVEPREGMPELQEFHEPEARTEPDLARSAPQTADRDTRELVDEISKEQERRIQARRAEAKELEQRAKELEKQAKEEEKARKEFEQHTRYVEELAPELGLDPNRPITVVPDLEGTGFEEIEFSTIQEDYAYIRIVYHEDASRYLYQVLEPELNDTEQEVLEFLQDTLVRTMDGRRGDEDQDWETYLEDEIERAILDHSILVDRVGKQRLTYHLKRDFLGYGPIDVIMQDSMIEDISCDGPGIPIYVYHRQYESIRTNVVFDEETELDSFVIRLAQRSGKHISIADPLLDATLPDTSRLQATLSREVTTRGSSFTIRKFRADPLTPPDLIRLGTLSSRMAAFLWIAMEDGAPMIMAGGTASGKTTTLNAMSQYIPPEKKVVSIEDTREINLIHENWIAGLTRSGFAGREGEGSIDMYRLLEAALRQRPEYLLVGEVRGPEAQTLFQAMATGHATYSTLHADSVRSAVYRLENPPIDVPRMMLQTLDGIAVQTQARVDNRYVRRIREFTEIVGIDSRTGDLLTNQVYDWNPDTDTYEYLGKSHILERRMDQMNLSPKEIEEEWSNRTLVLDWMVEKGIRHIEDVSNVIAAYYARPNAVMDRVRAVMDPEDQEELVPENLTEDLA